MPSTHFSVQTAEFIKEVYKDKEKIGLINFMHDITFGHGQISMLVSNPETFKFFSQNKIPMLCTDHSGRNLAEGIYLNKTLEESYKDCSVLMPLLPKTASHFNQNYGKNSLHIVAREKDCQHLYSLFFNLDEREFLHWIINNGTFIQNLIEDYKIKAKNIILEAKAPENRVTLPNSSDFFVKSANENSLRVNVIHKTLHVPIHLSPQQSRCLTYLMQGNSAKEIGIKMCLSYRTVEHYLEKIRRQLGCDSNRELMSTYYDQLNR